MDVNSELSTLIRRHEAPLIRHATRLLRDPEEARDAVQEGFIRYHRHRGEGETIDNPSAWLFRVVRNRCLDRLRLKRNQLEIRLDETDDVADFPDGSDGPDRGAARRDDMELARRHINELKPRDREVLILKVEQGKSYREIAEIMDLTVSNVGFILHQAIKSLAAAVKHRNDPVEGGDPS